MATLLQDLRWSLHLMRRNLSLTLIVVLSLGLAIGTNTAVFSVVNAFLLRPLPVEDIDRVVRLRESLVEPGAEPTFRSLWEVNYFNWKQHNEVFESMAAAAATNLNVSGGESAERLGGSQITWDFFPLLGLQPVLGRNMLPEEDRPGRGGVVLLGNSYWSSRLGSDPEIVGKTLTINGSPHTVIGVMQPHLRFPYDSDMWVPMAARNDPAESPNWRLYVLGRLKPGIAPERAEAEMTKLAGRLAVERPLDGAPTGAKLDLLRDELIENFRRLFLLLVVGAGFVLLIACANVSNLLLAQSVGRSNEVAVRVALGATRKTLVRQFLTYSMLLAVIGGALGILLTFWSIQPLISLTPLESIRDFDAQPRIDLPTLGFTMGVSLLVGIAFGLVPALRDSKVGLRASLSDGGRAGTLGTGGRRVLNAFVVSEIALALVLLVGASLMLQSFRKLHTMDRGFQPDHVLSFKVAFPDTKYPEQHLKAAFIQQAAERLRALPGVTAASVTSVEPFYPGQEYAAYNVEGQPANNSRGYHVVHHRTIEPGYFDTLKIPLLKGRAFTHQDTAESPFVVIVSKSFADRFWPGQDPIGKRVKRGLYDGERPWLTVVGMVGTLAESQDDENTSDAWYMPYTQPTILDITDMTFVLRTSADPKSMAASARQVISGLDRDQPIYDVLTMDERLENRTMPQRTSALLYGIMGGLGLILAALGIYGVLSFSVNQRYREIGIRSAMGARPADIKSMILKNAMLLTLIGLAVGIGGTLLLTRLLGSLLYEVRPNDPLTLVAALAGLALIALVSSYIPARRAAKTDPLRALRYE
ncbi:MAG TPA: ABC transporter permease [Thermoanaerobaculia bacterium]|nr:ABC transporter permease [Thermoanaerobaculia bacterium]